MIRLILILVTFFYCITSFGQLKKITHPSEYSEAEIFINERGEKFSTVFRIKFAQKTIDLRNGKKQFKKRILALRR